MISISVGVHSHRFAPNDMLFQSCPNTQNKADQNTIAQMIRVLVFAPERMHNLMEPLQNPYSYATFMCMHSYSSCQPLPLGSSSKAYRKNYFN